MDELEILFSLYALYLWTGLGAVVLLLALWLLDAQLRLRRLTRSYRELMGGVEQGNVEDALERQIAHLQRTGERVEAVGAELRQVEQALGRAIQRVGLVRYNPFDDTGGDQSFSIALLDASGDGLVLSSLFSRSANRVFAKPVQRGQSKFTLSEEEQQAIEKALGTARQR